MMHKNYLFWIVAALLLPGIAKAELIASPSAATVAAESKSKFTEMTGIDLTGYLDTSYNYLVRSNHFTSGKHDRLFDIEPNGFTLQQAAVTFSKLPSEGFGGLFNPLVGRDALATASFGTNPNVLGVQNIGFDIPQLYVQYAKDSVTVVGGKYNTLVGMEDFVSMQDTNFSRGIINFYMQPGEVLGFRGVYAPSSQLTWDAGINNGWDNIHDFSRRKTIELGINYLLDPRFSLIASLYSGQERATVGATAGPCGIRTLFDVVATYKATDKLSFAMNADYLIQSKALLPNSNLARAVAKGIAGYINYKLDEQWHTSFRGEVFNDQNGFSTGVRQFWRELTFTVGYSPIKNFELRAETRHDFSNVNSFVDKNGVNTSNNQQSFGLEMLYKFV